MEIAEGIPEKFRGQAAALYWDAFGSKIGKALGPRERALRYFESCFSLNQAFMAYEDDLLLGMAGFDLGRGGVINESIGEMFRIYGISAAWRMILLSVFDRPRRIKNLYIDGITVAQNVQGQGIGTALLKALEDKARSENCQFISLDVTNTNHRAQALYEAHGFEVIQTSQLKFFARFFPFQATYHMTKMVSLAPS